MSYKAINRGISYQSYVVWDITITLSLGWKTVFYFVIIMMIIIIVIVIVRLYIAINNFMLDRNGLTLVEIRL